MLYLIVENINGRFRLNDFKVYYEAAQAFLHGTIPFGLETGYYKYSPATLLLFTPYCAFSFETARILHFILLSCCAIFTIVFLHRLVSSLLKGKDSNRLLTSVFICILIHLVRELHLGNINIMLVLLVSVALFNVISGKDKVAGWLLGLAFVTKPYFLLLLLPLVFHQKKATLLHTRLSFVFFGIAPAAVIGFSDNIALHQKWFEAMLAHNSYLTSDNTLASLLQIYTSVAAPEHFGVYFLAMLGLLYIFVFWMNRKKTSTLGESAEGFMDRTFMIEKLIL